MDAVTYPEHKVVEYISKNMIALRVPPDNKKLMSTFNITWTPTLVILDADGKEHRRIVGFLPPEELVPALLLGIAQSHFERERFTEALTGLGELIAAYPKSKATPEAIFLRGACGYKHTHNPGLLKEAYQDLSAVYPQSEWAQRAAPYRLL
jgi:TolA-binding protein